MSDCKHPKITSFTYKNGSQAPLWMCVECNRKFVPIDRQLELEKQLETEQAAHLYMVGQCNKRDAEIAQLKYRLAAFERNEYICQKCHLRKDGEIPEGAPEF